MTIDARIMGVESRMDNIRQTQASLGIPDSRVFLDTERRGVVWNAKRAWLAPTEATHVMVLQDDIELSKGFLGICQRIVEAHPDKVVSLFPFQFQRPDSLRCGSPRNLRSPYAEAFFVSGVGIILPADQIKEIFDRFPIEAPHDDVFIQKCALEIGMQCITTIPATLQHIGDESELGDRAPRRTAFFDPDPSWADWESHEVLPWREVYQEAPKEDVSLNVEIAGRVVEIRKNGVKGRMRGELREFVTDKPADEFLIDPDPWDPALFRENLRQRLADHLIWRDILPIYARTVVIDGRGLLLVGEKKHEGAFRLRERLRSRARVLMGSVQALQMVERPDSGGSVAEQKPRLVAHATPFTDRYPWEESSADAPAAQIHRILILPQDVAFLSSGAFDPESLFTEESSPEVLPELIRALILPDGLPLRLKALSLIGELAKVDTRIDNLTDTK